MAILGIEGACRIAEAPGHERSEPNRLPSLSTLGYRRRSNAWVWVAAKKDRPAVLQLSRFRLPWLVPPRIH